MGYFFKIDFFTNTCFYILLCIKTSKIITKFTLYKRKLFCDICFFINDVIHSSKKKNFLEVFIYRMYEIKYNNTKLVTTRFSKFSWLHKNFLQDKRYSSNNLSKVCVIVLLQDYLCISSWANKTILRRIHFFKKYYSGFLTYSMCFKGLSFKSSWLLTSPSTYWSWPRFISTYVFQIEYFWQR